MVRVTTKEITLMKYNLEMGITAIVDAKVEKTGEIIIPAKVFSDIIRRIESDEVTIEADDRCLVQITGGVSQFTILGMTSEEFPEPAGGRGSPGLLHPHGDPLLHGGYDPLRHCHQ